MSEQASVVANVQMERFSQLSDLMWEFMEELQKDLQKSMHKLSLLTLLKSSIKKHKTSQALDDSVKEFLKQLRGSNFQPQRAVIMIQNIQAEIQRCDSYQIQPNDEQNSVKQQPSSAPNMSLIIQETYRHLNIQQELARNRAASQANIQNMQARLENTQARLETTQASLETTQLRMDSYINHIVSLQQTITQLNQSLAIERQRQNQRLGQLATLRQTISKLHQTLTDERERQNNKLDQFLTDLQRKFNDLILIRQDNSQSCFKENDENLLDPKRRQRTLSREKSNSFKQENSFCQTIQDKIRDVNRGRKKVHCIGNTPPSRKNIYALPTVKAAVIKRQL